MDKIEQLLSDLREEQNIVLNELNEKKEELSKKILAKDAKTAELKEREKKLEENEIEFVKKTAEVNEKFSKILSDEQIKTKWNEANTMLGQDEELLKQIIEERGLNVCLLEEIAKREVAVTTRESTYEQEIRKKFADKLLK